MKGMRLAEAAAFLALAAGCANNRGRVQPEPAVVLEGSGGPVRVRVEVAAREEERMKGLMFRERLPQDAGMLFVYADEDVRAFWMKNTYLSLDLVFIGANLRVLGAVENTVPLSTEHVGVQHPAQYVLEVNAGFVKRHGIAVGSAVKLEGVVPAPF